MELFQDMTAILKPVKCGTVTISHYTPDAMDIFQSERRGQDADKRTVAVLEINGRLMMSDGPYERRTNYGIVNAARGNVLIAGLGIGMILVPILRKQEVDKVIVVEKHLDVISVVYPQLDSIEGMHKLHMVHADINEWRPSKSMPKFDCVYFDIWPDICTDNLKDMTKLHRAFARYKVPGGYMDSWCRDLLKSRKRREDRNPYGY